MDFSQTKKPKIVLTRFPLESDFGGEEKVISIFSRNFPVIFWGTCPIVHNIFSKKNHFSAFLVRDITAKKTLIFSPLLFLSLFLQGIFWLPFFRIRGVRVLIFHSFIEKIVLTPLAKILGFRVFWAHHAPLGNWFFQNPFLPLWRFFSRRVTLLVPTEFLKKELKKAHPKGQVIVLENPVSMEKIEKVPHEGIIIGGAGRLEKDKNFDEFCILARYFPQISFLIAGEGSERKKLEKNAPPNIRFLGFLREKEMMNFWGNIDIFLSFSRSETFGMGAAESACAGIPSIVPRAGGFLEVVQNEKTGFLFETSEEAQEIIKLLEKNEDQRKKMGESAKTFSEKWSERKFREKMGEILKKGF